MKSKRYIFLTVLFAILSIAFTVATKLIDVRPAGPQGSLVGFAALNIWMHEHIGVNMVWYKITEMLGIIPILTVAAFAVLGLLQLIRGRSIWRVDRKIIALGIFYVVVTAVYVFFEKCTINFRPVLIDGVLSASYPSSHTLMSVCFMAAVIIMCRYLISGKSIYRLVAIDSYLFIFIIVIGRLISGVHWFTDIIGGLLISAALISAFAGVCSSIARSQTGMSGRSNQTGRSDQTGTPSQSARSGSAD